MTDMTQLNCACRDTFETAVLPSRLPVDGMKYEQRGDFHTVRLAENVGYVSAACTINGAFAELCKVTGEEYRELVNIVKLEGIVNNHQGQGAIIEVQFTFPGTLGKARDEQLAMLSKALLRPALPEHVMIAAGLVRLLTNSNPLEGRWSRTSKGAVIETVSQRNGGFFFSNDLDTSARDAVGMAASPDRR